METSQIETAADATSDVVEPSQDPAPVKPDAGSPATGDEEAGDVEIVDSASQASIPEPSADMRGMSTAASSFLKMIVEEAEAPFEGSPGAAAFAAEIRSVISQEPALCVGKRGRGSPTQCLFRYAAEVMAEEPHSRNAHILLRMVLDPVNDKAASAATDALGNDSIWTELNIAVVRILARYACRHEGWAVLREEFGLEKTPSQSTQGGD